MSDHYKSLPQWQAARERYVANIEGERSDQAALRRMLAALEMYALEALDEGE